MITTYKNVTTTYAYDGTGMRVGKTKDSVTTKYYWDRNYVANESQDGVITATNYISSQGIFARKTTSTEYLVKDGHGNTVGTIQNQTINKTYSYDAYGNHQTMPTDTNPLRYCGEYYGDESGLIYLRNRYYDPSIGRFINEDPVQDGVNWYGYCGWNPISMVDFWGLYDRGAAVNYAYEYGEGTNDVYGRFDSSDLSLFQKVLKKGASYFGINLYGGDCANFVSQCLVAGGLVENTQWHFWTEEWHGNNSIKHKDPSTVWVNANENYNFFSSDWAGYRNGEVLQIWTSEGMLLNIQWNNIQPGDLMYFAKKTDRIVHHATIITKVKDGEILFAAHTGDHTEESLSKHLDDEMVFIVRIREDAINGFTK